MISEKTKYYNISELARYYGINRNLFSEALKKSIVDGAKIRMRQFSSLTRKGQVKYHFDDVDKTFTTLSFC